MEPAGSPSHTAISPLPHTSAARGDSARRSWLRAERSTPSNRRAITASRWASSADGMAGGSSRVA